MIDAYRARFEVVVLGEDLSEANKAVGAWRSIAEALGHNPGQGTVRRVADGDLDHLTASMLAEARAKAAGVARPAARERAIAGLASHMDGDLERALQLIEAIEGEGGQLPAEVGRWLADGRLRPQEASA
jgi:hypothetical protein